jgi:hypothetical protein
MSGFSKAVDEAQAQILAKSERELASALRKHGIPERHDLGRLLGLRERFTELSGENFERVVQAARERKGGNFNEHS